MTLNKCPFPHKNNNFRRNIIYTDNKEFKAEVIIPDVFYKTENIKNVILSLYQK